MSLSLDSLSRSRKLNSGSAKVQCLAGLRDDGLLLANFIQQFLDLLVNSFLWIFIVGSRAGATIRFTFLILLLQSSTMHNLTNWRVISTGWLLTSVETYSVDQSHFTIGILVGIYLEPWSYWSFELGFSLDALAQNASSWVTLILETVRANRSFLLVILMKIISISY